MRRIQAFLLRAGLFWRDIDGVLITHEHSDHICGLETLARKTEIPVFAPHTVANRLLGRLPALADKLRIIPVGEAFGVGELCVMAFHTPHDTDESVGNRAEGEGCFAMATDMGHVSQEVVEGLLGADIALIESNHDLDLLCDGPYPLYLKRRIRSEFGHLSNEDAADLAVTLCANGTRSFILGHISRHNNTPAKALDAVSSALREALPEVLLPAVYTAPECGPLSVEVKVSAPCSL